MCLNCAAKESEFKGFTVCESCGLWQVGCVEVLGWKRCEVWELQGVGVEGCESCEV